MTSLTASPQHFGDPAGKWLWLPVKAMALLVAIAFAVRLGAVPDTTPPPPPSIVQTPRAAPAESLPAPEPAVLRTLSLDRPLEHGDYAWEAAAAGGAGPLRIHVDLSDSTLSVFRGNVEIGRAYILSGTAEQPTPTGSFTVTQKNADHISNIYDVPMPWMLRLTDDGIAIHGSVVEPGGETRGCVGVPDEFAVLLFEQARIGTRVTITA